MPGNRDLGGNRDPVASLAAWGRDRERHQHPDRFTVSSHRGAAIDVDRDWRVATERLRAIVVR